jgi:hypothetical protein
MDLKQAEIWIKQVFADDILTEDYDEFKKGFMCLMPSMSAESFILVYNYYSGESRINTSQPETSNRVYIELSKFVEFFFNVIDAEKSVEDNIKAMIEETIKENRGMLLIAYFNLWLDKIKYPNFADIRLIFHNLYKAYDKSYDPDNGIDKRAETLAEIKKACLAFENFVSAQESKFASSSLLSETRKEFFTWT